MESVAEIEEKVCGKCAQSEKMEIELRIKLALSRVPGTPYMCPVCKGVHSLLGFKFSI
jgi:hypothetical protein